MFDRASRLAERAAVDLSRRRFFSHLGRMGAGALALATLVGRAAGGGAVVRCYAPLKLCWCDNGIATCCDPSLTTGCTVDPNTGNCNCMG
jgi:hypothetical protein